MELPGTGPGPFRMPSRCSSTEPHPLPQATQASVTETRPRGPKLARELEGHTLACHSLQLSCQCPSLAGDEEMHSSSAQRHPTCSRPSGIESQLHEEQCLPRNISLLFKRVFLCFLNHFFVSEPKMPTKHALYPGWISHSDKHTNSLACGPAPCSTCFLEPH